MKADTRLDASPPTPAAGDTARLRDEHARLQGAVIDTLNGVIEEQRRLLLDQTADIVELRRLLKLREDLLLEQQRLLQAKDAVVAAPDLPPAADPPAVDSAVAPMAVDLTTAAPTPSAWTRFLSRLRRLR